MLENFVYITKFYKVKFLSGNHVSEIEQADFEEAAKFASQREQQEYINEARK